MNSYLLCKIDISPEASEPRTSWRGFDDIGKSFKGVVLTKSDYLIAENNYIAFITFLLRKTAVQELRVRRFNIIPPISDECLEELDVSRVKEILSKPPELIKSSEVDLFIQLILREVIRCELVDIGKSLALNYIYDFNFLIELERQVDKESLIKAESSGLYFNEWSVEFSFSEETD